MKFLAKQIYKFTTHTHTHTHAHTHTTHTHTYMHTHTHTHTCTHMHTHIHTHTHTHTYMPHSLVPRPFPPPVFDRLQYANMEGEGLGDLVTCGYIR